MSREEMERIHNAYSKAFGVGFSHPPLDFGIHAMPLDDLYGYAKAAIESGKPINWHEILGPTLREIDPTLMS